MGPAANKVIVTSRPVSAEHQGQALINGDESPQLGTLGCFKKSIHKKRRDKLND